MQTMIHRQVLAAAAAVACGAAAVGWLPLAQAATPKDMLVMAGTLMSSLRSIRPKSMSWCRWSIWPTPTTG